MKRRGSLESLLVDWGREYGGGSYEDIGWPGASPLATLMKYHGRAPDGLVSRVGHRTAADDVERAVRALEMIPIGVRMAQALRSEYMARADSRDQREAFGGQEAFLATLEEGRKFVAQFIGCDYQGLTADAA